MRFVQLRHLMGIASVAFACGCGTSDSGGDAADCGAAPAREGVQAVALPSAVPLCGRGGVGFASQQIGGGQISPGLEVLHHELGSGYVVIDPSCRFVAYRVSKGQGTAYAGWLDAEQAAEVDSFLSLEEWDVMESRYGWGGVVSDAPDNYFAWGRRTVHLIPAALPTPPQAFPHDLTRLNWELFAKVMPFGTPVCGPVRYSLIGPSSSTTRTASSPNPRPTWPLDTPPEAVATSPSAQRPPAVHVATGEDAARLRNLRERFFAGEFGHPFSEGGVPIVQANGDAFWLYVRDVVEFERDVEPFVPWAEPGDWHGFSGD